MRNQKQNKQSEVASIREIMAMTSKKLREFNSAKEPSAAAVSAAKAHSSLVSSYLGPIRVAMQAAKMTGEAPDLGYIGIAAPKPVKQIEATTE